MSAEWYYAEQGKEKSGPISADTLARIVNESPEIRSSTLVWRKGMADWVAASEVEELDSSIPPPMVPLEDSENPYTSPSANPLGKNTATPVKPANFTLYLGSQIVAMITFFIVLILNLPEDPSSIQTQEQALEFLTQPEMIRGTILAGLVYLFSTILSLIYLYRAWTALGPRESLSPALVVALMCVPILNIGWRFVAYWKWAQRWNQEFNQSSAPLMPTGIFLGFCISITATVVIPFAGIAAIPLMWISVYHMCRAINSTSTPQER